MDFSKLNIVSNKKKPRQIESIEETISKAQKNKDPDYIITVKRSESFGHVGKVRVVVTNARDGYTHATSIGTEKNKDKILKSFVREYKKMGKIQIVDLVNDNGS